MAVTYAELTQQILDYTEVSTDVLTSTRTNDFIEHAENRIFRDVDLDVFKSHQTANLVASNAFLSLPGGTTPTPESLGTIRTMQIFSSKLDKSRNIQLFFRCAIRFRLIPDNLTLETRCLCHGMGQILDRKIHACSCI